MTDLTREELAARGLRVRELVWRDVDDPDAYERAEAMGQEYSVGFEDGSWFAYSDTRCADIGSGYHTRDEAKIAVIGHYTARILAALEPTEETK